MARAKKKRPPTLAERYPASPPCSCEVCLRFCQRPGWWTVSEATAVIAAGHGNRVMLELAPDRSFGVLAPAFKGNEAKAALNMYASRGCTFLKEGLCELHGTGLMPLECRYCHHDRPGQGPKCHADLEQDWRSAAGKTLVARWIKESGLWERQLLFR
jgi:hypothetical protein